MGYFGITLRVSILWHQISNITCIILYCVVVRYILKNSAANSLSKFWCLPWKRASLAFKPLEHRINHHLPAVFPRFLLLSGESFTEQFLDGFKQCDTHIFKVLFVYSESSVLSSELDQCFVHNLQVRPKHVNYKHKTVKM